ncbi:MAG: hypothetical protein APF80_01065 [Alphaproteobacteria bacterium BRH_c36]|nr:MAG: hypothetical protein APF80_01065 [Alphaproteobacteria bacterium BRH_c36]
MRDGELLAFAEEERFVREKTAVNRYPAHAVKFCLEYGGIDITEVTSIAFGWNAQKYAFVSGGSQMEQFYDSLSKIYSKDVKTLASEKEILLRFQPERIESTLFQALSEVGIRVSKKSPTIQYFSHHHCHAASAFFCSGFASSSILTIDGSGEETCLALWEGRGSQIQITERVELPNSLGWLYSCFTEYLGFRPYRDEGKVMALAAYGRPDTNLERVFDKVTGLVESFPFYRVDPNYIFYGRHSYGRRFTDKLVTELGAPREPCFEVDQVSADIAYQLQKRLEDAVLSFLRHTLAKRPKNNLCLAGGVALNCKLNRVLATEQKEGLFEGFFIQPLSSDAGTALGAALLENYRIGLGRHVPLKHLYWGPNFSNDEISGVLRKSGVKYNRVSSVATEAAQLLSEGSVVAWFQGRAEAGPRALGNRSILANPTSSRHAEAVNLKLKRREPWRPFGSSMLLDAADDILIRSEAAPFMIQSFLVKDSFRKQIPAVVHIDGSTRPQTVTRENELLHEILEKFRDLTGMPLVLNTSFNGLNEPLVNTPDEAIETYLGSDLDALIIGEFVIKRNGTSPSDLDS